MILNLALEMRANLIRAVFKKGCIGKNVMFHDSLAG
jgi:hypothetical protein